MAADLLTVRRLHPEWDIVDVVEAPNGGIWALGRDGGVFALNAEGGTTGTTAPFGGAYTTLAPEQRQGTRTFEDIQASEGGYTLVSNIPGQTYRFFTPTAPIQSTTAPTNVTGTNTAADIPQPASESGKDVFLNTLVGMGFSRDQANSLGNQLWTNSKTKTSDALYFDLINSPEYAARFPGMKALREKGTAIDESQYIGLERQYEAVANSAQLPAQFRERSDFGQLIAKGVSPDEYAGRIRWAQTAALSDPVFLEELQRQVPGANLGDVTAFYLDPDRGTQVLNEKTIRAQIGTSARTTGFGQLSVGETERLQAGGVSADEAQVGFAQLGGGIMSNTIEESMSDDQFTRQEALGFVTESGRGGASTAELERRRSRRQAQFQGGGGAASGGGGRTGLG